MTDNNNNREKDAFDAMFEYMDINPDASIDNIASYLAENGYANSADSVKRFYLAMINKEE